MTTVNVEDRDQIKDVVRTRYGRIAGQVLDHSAIRASCCSPVELAPGVGPAQDVIPVKSASTSCCGPGNGAGDAQTTAAGLLYEAGELDGLPESVTAVSLGCGNPTAIAALRPGQVVLDLGSGGGIDCFLAARQVGPEGRVIGLDMTPEMIELAERNKAALGETAANVTFQLGEMEAMPLADASVDVIISNCVINLSPDKDAVFREAYRVLRPGGTLAVSDIVALKPLPDGLVRDLAAWSGCVAGALDVATYRSKLEAAGFQAVEVTDLVPTDFGVSEGVHGDEAQAAAKTVPGGLQSWIASARVVARKP